MAINGYGYDGLKALAARLGRPLHSLICLADDNDPYLADRPGRRRERAEWFARLWTELAIPNGSHIRRIHYVLVSTASIVLPDGSPYLNTHSCWKFLGSASADARYLGLVDPGAFVDRRAPEAIVYIPDDEATAADFIALCRLREFETENTPYLGYRPTEYDFPDLPNIVLNPPQLAEPYAIVLVCEKSTVNDVLEPIAQAHRVGLITGVGELSITHCYALQGRLLHTAGRREFSISAISTRPARPCR